MNSDIIAAAEKAIGYTFADKSLLVCALTHKSYVNENGGISNGRLEYLGDSVLNLIVAEYLYSVCPDDEGTLTEVRKTLVSRTPLCHAVRDMGLLDFYRMGKGAKVQLSGFGEKPVSDICESVLGAIYLDGGLDSARSFVKIHLLDKIKSTDIIG